MRITALLGLAMGFGLATAAIAQSAGTSAPANSTASDPDRIICHDSPAPTGSRLGGHRECHTQKQWEMMRQQDQQTLNSMQMKGMDTRPPGG